MTTPLSSTTSSHSTLSTGNWYRYLEDLSDLVDEVVDEVAADVEAAHHQHRGGKAAARLLHKEQYL